MSNSVSSSSALRRPSAAIVRMRWHDLLFIHWPVDVAMVRKLVPEQFEIDCFEGAAWVGLIPFFMTFRVRGLPPIPTMHRFPECNVRTYVTHRGEPGVWFFSLDASSRLAVWGARRRWHLNYVHARMSTRRRGDVVEYSVQRTATPDAGLRATWHVGDPLPIARRGDLAHFLTERYALFTIDGRGRVGRGPIDHRPWPLRAARLEHLDDRLVSAAGITIPRERPPVLHHADLLDVKAWPLERLD